jgi:ribosomal protein S18 acetylase RimI-like enzyme
VQAVAVTLRIRPRVDDDLDACGALARTTHHVDGYPAYVRDDDFRGFVLRPEALAAWVAEIDSQLVGHVALNARTTAPAMELACSNLSVSMEQLGVIARLMVAPDARRHGVGEELLRTTTEDAWARDLTPILDVVTRHAAAIALYERAGWQRLGKVSFRMPDGSALEEYVYCAP